MTIGARVSSGRKRRGVEEDAAFRLVKIPRPVGPDRGRKAHDKERPVIQKTKTNKKRRRARSISLHAPHNLLCRRRFALHIGEGSFGIKYPVTLRSPSGSDAGSNYSPPSGSDSVDLVLTPTLPPKSSGTSSTTKSSKSRTSAQVR